MKSVSLLFLFLFSITTCFTQENDSIIMVLKERIKKSTDNQEIVKSMLDLGKHYLNSDLTLSEKYLKQAETKIKKNDLTNSSFLNLHLAALDRKKGNYSKAKEYGLKAKLLFEKNKDTLGLATCLISLGITDRYRKNNDESIAYYNRAIELSRLKKDTLLMGNAFNMKGIAYRRLNILDSAMHNYNRAMELLTSIKNEGHIVSVKNNMAVVYSRQGLYQKSLPLLLDNLKYNKKVNSTMSIAIGYYNIAVDYNRIADYKQSMKYIDSSFSLSQNLGYRFRVAKAAQLKSTLKKRMGDYEAALDYSNLYHAISDSIFSLESEKKLREFELKREFDLEKKEMEFLSEVQRSKTRTYIFLLVVLLIVGIMMTYLVVRNYKGKIKYVATKLEKQRLEKELLNEKVKVSEAELKWLIADNKMRLTYLQKFYDKLKLDYKNETLKQMNVYIRSLMLAVQQQISTEEKLSSIQSKIEDVNLGFESKIIQEHPSLTKAEREVCALLRVNLSIKEVASIRNTTIDSIKSIRYRLRKKMGVPKNVELESFIQSL